ncbi:MULTISPECIES: LacI family DNA-binding transcriptional regulator [Alteromonadaceae]|jgi:LacI family transcriptional regulator|uniref:LacI family DNA-binding transcriptional regulator n=1 Tax=Brumicola blandensis TaxID=3075611 RepID=A0AAW8QW09_9ALTE|nr:MULTISPECIES: LacI family DNA-binding transcriptional regulator [unclassified Alteromonas]MDT0581217.1 LacI family DNA-binding transcriptional regulator [Alteromonas sp. W409]MDT0626834.1 LacI family DNA-binding transcriptional regulator [Alteromonas sp. W364]
MATIYEVSKAAGVSLATVSRVINKNAVVSAKTREKVEQAMLDLGYRPNTIAQSLASSKSNSVGVLVSELDSPFFGEMMSGIETELRRAGKQVIFAAGHNTEKIEKESIEFLLSRFCDALIIHVEETPEEYLQQLSEGKVPIYLINRVLDSMKNRCVHMNNELGGYRATKFALDNGHTQIAYIAGPQQKEDAMERLRGYQQALTESGIDFDDSLIVYGDYSEQSGSDCYKQLVDKPKKFSALICGNDEMASGAMKQARDEGVDIPNDLSIIGFDNTSFAQYLYPQLTTIDNPIGQMGQMAACMVLNDVYGHKHAIQRYFEPELVKRKSLIQYTE